MTTTTDSGRCLVRTLLAGLVLSVACASSPPPPPSSPAPASASETVPPPPAEPAAAPPPQEEAPAQAQADCQAADDCKSRGEPATGFQWTCDGGHCMEQAAAEPPKPEEKAVTEKSDKPSKAGKKKGKKN